MVSILLFVLLGVSFTFIFLILFSFSIYILKREGMVDILSRRSANLHRTSFVVLDETDRLIGILFILFLFNLLHLLWNFQIHGIRAADSADNAKYTTKQTSSDVQCHIPANRGEAGKDLHAWSPGYPCWRHGLYWIWYAFSPSFLPLSFPSLHLFP